MRLLDLFCGAGGAAVGYHRAGFDEIVGVDIVPQPRYPFKFVQGNALEYVVEHGQEFDMTVAGPPCQGYSISQYIHGNGHEHPKLIEPLRGLLLQTGKPYVIENVPGAPLINPVLLCGLMFGLKVFRHRLFECSPWILSPMHLSHRELRIGVGGYCCVAGHGDSGNGLIDKCHRTKAAWEIAMDIDWMTKYELTQAIPPAYTEWIGRQMLPAIGARIVAAEAEAGGE